jgi:hypothetical protein
LGRLNRNLAGSYDHVRSEQEPTKTHHSLLEAARQPTKVLEASEIALDAVPAAIQLSRPRARPTTSTTPGDGGYSTTLVHAGNEGIAIVRSVTYNRSNGTSNLPQEARRRPDISALARRNRVGTQGPARSHRDMDLRAQAPPRPANSAYAVFAAP